MQGGGLCENAPNLRLDTFNVEIGAMMAPRPMIMISATGDWTKNNATEEFPAVHAIYELYDKAANVEMVHQDAPHNYNQAGREAVYRFFGKHVLGETDAAKFKERSIRVEKLQDMLALHNRKLPDNALDYDGIFAQWVRTAQNLVGWNHGPRPAARDDGIRAGRGVAGARGQRGQGREDRLRAPGPRRPRDGAVDARRGAQGTASFIPTERRRRARVRSSPHWCAPAGPSTRSTRFRPEPPWRRATATPRCSSPSTGATMPTACRTSSPFCAGWTRPRSNSWVSGRRPSGVSSPRRLREQKVILKADVSNFTGTDQEYLDRFFVPGIQRAGGLRVARLLSENRE